jgi:hypothetical protein
LPRSEGFVDVGLELGDLRVKIIEASDEVVDFGGVGDDRMGRFEGLGGLRAIGVRNRSESGVLFGLLLGVLGTEDVVVGHEALTLEVEEGEVIKQLDGFISDDLLVAGPDDGNGGGVAGVSVAVVAASAKVLGVAVVRLGLEKGELAILIVGRVRSVVVDALRKRKAGFQESDDDGLRIGVVAFRKAGRHVNRVLQFGIGAVCIDRVDVGPSVGALDITNQDEPLGFLIGIIHEMSPFTRARFIWRDGFYGYIIYDVSMAIHKQPKKAFRHFGILLK